MGAIAREPWIKGDAIRETMSAQKIRSEGAPLGRIMRTMRSRSVRAPLTMAGATLFDLVADCPEAEPIFAAAERFGKLRS
jgi:hypothetical protein